MNQETTEASPHWFALVAVGLVGGLFAGVFGVGGGLVMVPLLIWWAKMAQRLAHATSLLAITPAAIVGAVSYGIGGIFEWEIALIVATGSVIGAQIGAWLLRTISIGLLRWGFIAFVLGSSVGLFLESPERGGTLEITILVAILLFLLGLAMGVSAGLFGIGGGVIVIPVLMLGFGQSDLLAKGVSLLAMAPGSISGSISHLRHGSTRLRHGAWVAAGAIVTTPIGAYVAFALDPTSAGILFAVLLLIVATNLTIRAVRQRGKD